MVVDFIHAFANLTLALLLARFIMMKLSPNSDLKKAMAFIYG